MTSRTPGARWAIHWARRTHHVESWIQRRPGFRDSYQELVPCSCHVDQFTHHISLSCLKFTIFIHLSQYPKMCLKTPLWTFLGPRPRYPNRVFTPEKYAEQPPFFLYGSPPGRGSKGKNFTRYTMSGLYKGVLLSITVTLLQIKGRSYTTWNPILIIQRRNALCWNPSHKNRFFSCLRMVRKTNSPGSVIFIYPTNTPVLISYTMLRKR